MAKNFSITSPDPRPKLNSGVKFAPQQLHAGDADNLIERFGGQLYRAGGTEKLDLSQNTFARSSAPLPSTSIKSVNSRVAINSDFHVEPSERQDLLRSGT